MNKEESMGSERLKVTFKPKTFKPEVYGNTVKAIDGDYLTLYTKPSEPYKAGTISVTYMLFNKNYGELCDKTYNSLDNMSPKVFFINVIQELLDNDEAWKSSDMRLHYRSKFDTNYKEHPMFRQYALLYQIVQYLGEQS